jgi:outer membrane protein
MIFRVADSYLTILEANAQLVSARAERDAVKRQLEQVQQRFDVGLVAITDVLESTAAFDSSTVNVIEAEGRQDISFETLLRLTGERYAEIEGLAEEFPIEYPEPNNEDAWVERALEGNYQLIAAKENVGSAQRSLYAAKSQFLPTVDAQAVYAESNTGTSNAFLGSVEQTSYSLVFNVPVFTGGATYAGSKRAGYQLEQAQRNYDLIQRQTVENTRNLFSAINTDVARVRARLRGIESSQSALDATQTGYEVGTRNIVDVLLAQQRLYLAQFQYAVAKYQYIRDTLRLKQTVGSLSPEDIYALNKFVTSDISVARISPTTR